MFEHKAGELAMHVAAGPNAVNNFLSDVTAFSEVERVGLFGFLRQIALANVLAVTWNAEGDSVKLNCVRADWSCTRLQQCVPKRLKVGGREPDFIGFVIFVRAAHHSALQATALARTLNRKGLDELQLRNLNSRCLQNVARLRTGEADDREFIAAIGDLHVVHDDVVIEGGENLLQLAAVGVNQDALAAVVRVKIAKNAALRVEQESIDAAVDLEIPDIVGDHAVQPAHAVTAGQHDFGAPAEIINPAARAQGGELRPRIAEVSDSVWATILAALSYGRFFVKSWKHDAFSLDYNGVMRRLARAANAILLILFGLC